MDAPKFNVATGNDIECVYYILLSRSPDSGAIKPGLPIQDLLASVVGSEEFRARCRRIILENQFSTTEGLTASDLNRARQWCGQYLKDTAETKNSDWAGLLGAILKHIEEMNIDEIEIGLIELLSQHEEDRKSNQKEAEVDELFEFDADWFREAYGISDIITDENLSIGHHPVTNEMMQPLSLFQFDTKVLDRLERRHLPLRTMLSVLKEAALTGAASHWLWHEAHYVKCRNKFFAEYPEKKWPTLNLEYLDFLVNGDANDLSPHPLFSPVCYRQLNKLDSKISRTFQHYLSKGMFLGLRTSVLFDANYYRQMNSQFMDQFHERTLWPAIRHAITHGLKNGANCLPDFSSEDYTARYGDIKSALDAGAIPSAVFQFLYQGIDEGRIPNNVFDPGYYIQRYALHNSAAMQGCLSSLEHFLLFGSKKYRSGCVPLGDRPIDLGGSKGLYERRSRRSLERIWSHGLTIESGGDARPLLSVIVPVHNQADFTARFLEQAVFAVDDVKYKMGRDVEIIIVSNGSSDSTADLLNRCRGIRSLVLEQAIGYPAAINEGAKIASGDVLLLSNNDVEFDPDAFRKLVQALLEDENIGAIGPVILQMDHTIQEIGSLVGNDGGVQGLNRSARLDRSLRNSIAEVDFVSGCFLAIRKIDFEKLGGLDLAFSPGYYEEVDLCLRLRREIGKTVKVASDLSIYHYEHASFLKGRPMQVNYPLIVRNRRKLLSKHPELQSRSSIQDIVSAPALVRNGFARPRILVIEDLLPNGSTGSGFGRSLEIIRHMSAANLSFDLFIVNPDSSVDNFDDPLVRVYRAWCPGESIEEILGRVPLAYSHVLVCRTHNLKRYAGLLSRLHREHGLTIVCDTEALSVARTISRAEILGRPYDDEEVKALVWNEVQPSSIVSAYIVVNETDKSLIEAAGIEAVTVIGHVSSEMPVTDAGFDKRRNVLSVGPVYEAGTPNHDALDWFVQSVCSHLDLTGHRLDVVGYWNESCVDRILNRANSVIPKFVGRVSNSELNVFYANARVAIAPTRFAAGIPLKVIEAMTAGVPVVMTDLLARQLGIVDHGGFAVAVRDDDGRDFAIKLSALLQDEDRWNDVRSCQLKFVSERYDSRCFGTQFAAAMTFLQPLSVRGGS